MSIGNFYNGLAAPVITAEDFAALAKAKLHATPHGAPGAGLDTARADPSDFDLNPSADQDFAFPANLRSAAVLVAIVAHPEPRVLLTQRTATLSAHAGQIAFPGGTVDAGDTGPLMTALRETHEEIGLDPALIAPVGYLDRYRTGTGFSIIPVVGLLEPGFKLELNASEVESSFEVPLSFLLDPANHKIVKRTFQGVDRQFYAIDHQGRYIWGATAGIIRNMYERLNRP